MSKSTPSRPGTLYQPKEPDTSRKGILAPTPDSAPTIDNVTSNVITPVIANDNVLPPVKRRKSDGIRQIGMRMPGDVYEEWVQWCNARAYAIGPTAAAALQEYMTRHAAD